MGEIVSKYQGDTQFHNPEFVSSHALLSVASTPGLLERSIYALEADSGQGEFGNGSLPPDVLRDLKVATAALPWELVVKQLPGSLHEVAAFARSDGSAVRESIKAVERLIRSGRVDLFCR